jgi:hypothetical protein
MIQERWGIKVRPYLKNKQSKRASVQAHLVRLPDFKAQGPKFKPKKKEKKKEKR